MNNINNTIDMSDINNINNINDMNNIIDNLIYMDDTNVTNDKNNI